MAPTIDPTLPPKLAGLAFIRALRDSGDLPVAHAGLRRDAHGAWLVSVMLCTDGDLPVVRVRAVLHADGGGSVGLWEPSSGGERIGVAVIDVANVPALMAATRRLLTVTELMGRLRPS